MSRFPCVLQVDETDCGAACLATVAERYGLSTALHKLRDAAGTGRDGVNLLGLSETAKRMGFEARAVEVEDRTVLGEIPTPWVAHVVRKDLLHFVVVHEARRGVTIADPAEGLCTLTAKEFNEMWSGYALLLAPEGPLREEEFKKASPLGRIFQFAMPFRGLLFHALLAGLLMTVLALASSFFNRFLFDEIIPSGRMKTLHLFGAAIIAVTLFSTVFECFRTYLMTHLGQKVDLHLMSMTYKRLLRLPMAYFNSRRSGDVLQRLNDTSHIQQAITGLFLGVILDGISLVVAGTVLLLYEWRMALLVLGTGPFFFLIAWAFGTPLRRRFRMLMEESARLNAQTVDNLAGIAVVKGAGAEELVFRKMEGPLVRLAQEERRTALLGLAGTTMAGLVHGFAMLGILWFGAAQVMQGHLSLGQIMLFSTIAGYVMGPLRSLAGANLGLQDALVAMDRLADVLDTEEEPLEEPGSIDIRGSLRIEGVRFAYGYDQEVLQGIEFECRAGEWIAVVGQSGAGKSTLFHLLQRFYSPKHGRILIDGTDIRDIPLRPLRRQVFLIEQECQIFAGSILDNLRIGRPEATLEEVIDACRVAGALDFIEKLPKRLHTVVGERGIGISGGERQRLAIARALVARPRILLLDEATAHLDVRIEREIVLKLRQALRTCTVLFCTHRLGLARSADRIVVLEQGKIVEEGTHESLLREEGTYGKMWSRQLGGSWDDRAAG